MPCIWAGRQLLSCISLHLLWRFVMLDYMLFYFEFLTSCVYFHFVLVLSCFLLFCLSYWYSSVWCASINIFKIRYVTISSSLRCTPHLCCAHICCLLCARVYRFAWSPNNYWINYLFSDKLIICCDKSQHEIKQQFLLWGFPQMLGLCTCRFFKMYLELYVYSTIHNIYLT